MEILKAEWLIAANVTKVMVDKWLAQLIEAMTACDITTPKRVAAFVAQVAHESNGLVATVENLNYSADGLLKIFPKYFKTQADAAAYARQPQRIANRVYANRLGNGDEASGEGWKYRGRGLVQVTGKKNYTVMAASTNLPLVDNPELLEQPVNAALSAAKFWKNNGCNELADADNFEAITRRINGGLIGQDDRLLRWKKVWEAINNG